MLCSAPIAFAQDTAFTYQTVLSLNGAQANDSNDFTLSLFCVDTEGCTQAGPITNLNVCVTDPVTVDFSLIGDTFYASDHWLEMATRTAGAGAFVSLTPRQPITSTPRPLYAGYAGSGAAAFQWATAQCGRCRRRENVSIVGSPARAAGKTAPPNDPIRNP